MEPVPNMDQIIYIPELFNAFLNNQRFGQLPVPRLIQIIINFENLNFEGEPVTSILNLTVTSESIINFFANYTNPNLDILGNNKEYIKSEIKTKLTLESEGTNAGKVKFDPNFANQNNLPLNYIENIQVHRIL